MFWDGQGPALWKLNEEAFTWWSCISLYAYIFTVPWLSLSRYSIFYISL